MRAQLTHLSNAARQSHVTVQVLPYVVGAHPGMSGSFVILQFDDPAAADVVYIESQASDLFLEGEADVARFAGLYEHLRALALPPDDSITLIQDIAREL